MDPNTGKIHTKPQDMSDADWAAFCKEQGLVSMTEDEFRRMAQLPTAERVRRAHSLRAFKPVDPVLAKAKKDQADKDKKVRREKNKLARRARKR